MTRVKASHKAVHSTGIAVRGARLSKFGQRRNAILFCNAARFAAPEIEKLNMGKRLILSVAIIAVGSFILTKMADERPFVELVDRAVMSDQAKSFNASCPLSQEYINKADLNLLAICSRYGLAAYDAARRYPVSGPQIFALYGGDQTFRAILDRYGHQVIPVVAYYVENRSSMYQLRQAFGEAVQQLWAGERPTWEPSRITPEEIGLLVINQIDARGQEFLAEFENVNGAARRKPMASTFLEIKDFLFGGVDNLETILIRAERLPTWGELGDAGIDATLIIGGVAALGKVRVLAREARIEGAAVERSSVRSIVKGAYGAIGGVSTAYTVGSISLLYIAVTHPSLIRSAAGWAAEQLGYDRVAGIFVAYFIILSIALAVLSPLIWCSALIVRPFVRLGSILWRLGRARQSGGQAVA